MYSQTKFYEFYEILYENKCNKIKDLIYITKKFKKYRPTTFILKLYLIDTHVKCI